jgi:hypothetical protein
MWRICSKDIWTTHCEGLPPNWNLVEALGPIKERRTDDSALLRRLDPEQFSLLFLRTRGMNVTTAFVSLQQARPCPTVGRPVHL